MAKKRIKKIDIPPQNATGTTTKSGVLSNSFKKQLNQKSFLPGGIPETYDMNSSSKLIFDDSLTCVFKQNANTNTVLGIPLILPDSNLSTINLRDEYIIDTNVEDARNIDVDSKIGNEGNIQLLLSNAGIYDKPNTIGFDNFTKTHDISQDSLDRFLEEKTISDDYKPYVEDFGYFKDKNNNFSNQSLSKNTQKIKNKEQIKISLDFTNKNPYFINTAISHNTGAGNNDAVSYPDAMRFYIGEPSTDDPDSGTNDLSGFQVTKHYTPTAYFNHTDSEWEYIDTNHFNINGMSLSENVFPVNFISEDNLDMVAKVNDIQENLLTRPICVSPAYRVDKAFSTSDSWFPTGTYFPEDVPIFANYSNALTPSDSYGFPNKYNWQPHNNHLLQMSNYIDKDFIVEKVIIKTKITANFNAAIKEQMFPNNHSGIPNLNTKQDKNFWKNWNVWDSPSNRLNYDALGISFFLLNNRKNNFFSHKESVINSSNYYFEKSDASQTGDLNSYLGNVFNNQAQIRTEAPSNEIIQIKSKNDDFYSIDSSIDNKINFKKQNKFIKFSNNFGAGAPTIKTENVLDVWQNGFDGSEGSIFKYIYDAYPNIQDAIYQDNSNRELICISSALITKRGNSPEAYTFGTSSSIDKEITLDTPGATNQDNFQYQYNNLDIEIETDIKTYHTNTYTDESQYHVLSNQDENIVKVEGEFSTLNFTFDLSPIVNNIDNNLITSGSNYDFNVNNFTTFLKDYHLVYRYIKDSAKDVAFYFDEDPGIAATAELLGGSILLTQNTTGISKNGDEVEIDLVAPGDLPAGPEVTVTSSVTVDGDGDTSNKVLFTVKNDSGNNGNHANASLQEQNSDIIILTKDNLGETNDTIEIINAPAEASGEGRPAVTFGKSGSVYSITITPDSGSGDQTINHETLVHAINNGLSLNNSIVIKNYDPSNNADYSAVLEKQSHALQAVVDYSSSFANGEDARNSRSVTDHQLIEIINNGSTADVVVTNNIAFSFTSSGGDGSAIINEIVNFSGGIDPDIFSYQNTPRDFGNGGLITNWNIVDSEKISQIIQQEISNAGTDELNNQEAKSFCLNVFIDLFFRKIFPNAQNSSQEIVDSFFEPNLVILPTSTNKLKFKFKSNTKNYLTSDTAIFDQAGGFNILTDYNVTVGSADQLAPRNKRIFNNILEGKFEYNGNILKKFSERIIDKVAIEEVKVKNINATNPQTEVLNSETFDFENIIKYKFFDREFNINDGVNKSNYLLKPSDEVIIGASVTGNGDLMPFFVEMHDSLDITLIGEYVENKKRNISNQTRAVKKVVETINKRELVEKDFTYNKDLFINKQSLVKTDLNTSNKIILDKKSLVNNGFVILTQDHPLTFLNSLERNSNIKRKNYFYDSVWPNFFSYVSLKNKKLKSEFVSQRGGFDVSFYLTSSKTSSNFVDNEQKDHVLFYDEVDFYTDVLVNSSAQLYRSVSNNIDSSISQSSYVNKNAPFENVVVSPSNRLQDKFNVLIDEASYSSNNSISINTLGNTNNGVPLWEYAIFDLSNGSHQRSSLKINNSTNYNFLKYDNQIEEDLSRQLFTQTNFALQQINSQTCLVVLEDQANDDLLVYFKSLYADNFSEDFLEIASNNNNLLFSENKIAVRIENHGILNFQIYYGTDGVASFNKNLFLSGDYSNNKSVFVCFLDGHEEPSIIENRITENRGSDFGGDGSGLEFTPSSFLMSAATKSIKDNAISKIQSLSGETLNNATTLYTTNFETDLSSINLATHQVSVGFLSIPNAPNIPHLRPISDIFDNIFSICIPRFKLKNPKTLTNNPVYLYDIQDEKKPLLNVLTQNNYQNYLDYDFFEDDGVYFNIAKNEINLKADLSLQIKRNEKIYAANCFYYESKDVNGNIKNMVKTDVVMLFKYRDIKTNLIMPYIEILGFKTQNSVTKTLKVFEDDSAFLPSTGFIRVYEENILKAFKSLSLINESDVPYFEIDLEKIYKNNIATIGQNNITGGSVLFKVKKSKYEIEDSYQHEEWFSIDDRDKAINNLIYGFNSKNNDFTHKKLDGYKYGILESQRTTQKYRFSAYNFGQFADFISYSTNTAFINEQNIVEYPVIKTFYDSYFQVISDNETDNNTESFNKNIYAQSNFPYIENKDNSLSQLNSNNVNFSRIPEEYIF